MRFKLEIECNNDAFQEDIHGEIAEILRDIADRIILQNLDEGSAFDINGNKVGFFVFRGEND